MKKNMGKLDRIVRIIVAIVFAGLYFSGVIGGIAGFLLFGMALIFLLTSTFSFCPLYMPCGLSTCQVDSKDEAKTEDIL